MVNILRTDVHSEITASGPVQYPQRVEATVSPTQSFVRLGREPVLREGDRFSCGHRPHAGPFAQPLPDGTGAGRLAQAGQQFVRLAGVPVATLAGTNVACSEGVRELDNRFTCFLTRFPMLRINGALVLTGPADAITQARVSLQ